MNYTSYESGFFCGDYYIAILGKVILLGIYMQVLTIMLHSYYKV